MELTGANSYLEEPGISFTDNGETIYGYITKYSFNVPAVSAMAATTGAKLRPTISSLSSGSRLRIKRSAMA